MAVELVRQLELQLQLQLQQPLSVSLEVSFLRHPAPHGVHV